MTRPDASPSSSTLSSTAWLLIIVAAAMVTGRIFSVTGREQATPFLSANDRSRWCTIRALVDQGTFVIDDIIFNAETGKREPGWHTIDLVKHRGIDGQEHYYSSKPVLMPTLMAGVYWLVKNVTGASLARHPYYAGRLVLWICNVPLLVLMWWLLARRVEKLTNNEWTRCFLLAAMLWGTLLTSFAITLNNHLHAAVFITLAMECLLLIETNERRSPWLFALAGFSAALVFANELPALSFLVFLGGYLLYRHSRPTLTCFVPAAALVVVAMTTLNYVAHGTWRPPYDHRKDGPVVATLTTQPLEDGSLDVADIARQLQHEATDVTMTPRAPFNPGDDVTNRWNYFDRRSQMRYALYLRDPASGQLEVRAWDNWYDYEGTYWTAERKQGVDRGESSPAVYAFHALVGHHGLFTLTPLWLLTAWGVGLAIYRRDGRFLTLAGFTLALTVVCLGFYLTRPIHDRNYGGVCNGLRWMMWLAPLYLLTLIPAVEWLAKSRGGRAIALAFLAVSGFSALYKPLNPWTHPWLFDYWEYLQWIDYG